MGQIDVLKLVLLLAGLAMMLFYRVRLVEALIEALNRFGGGPPTGMHPSPACDSQILGSKRRQSES
jgi:hypothetical protein